MTQTGKRQGAVFAVVAVAALALVFFWVRPSSDGASDGAGLSSADASANSVDGAGDDRTPPLPGQVVAGGQMDLVSSADAIPANLPAVENEDPAEYQTKLPADTLFAAMPAARSHFAEKVPFGVDDRSYIEFNRNALRELAAGSTLTLRTPDDGREHQVRIDEVQVHANGDKSWLGRVDDGKGGAMPAVFTQGVDSSFGSFNTSTGSYSIEAEGKLGWIANVNDLRKHQNFDIDDAVVPDPSRNRPTPSTN